MELDYSFFIQKHIADGAKVFIPNEAGETPRVGSFDAVVLRNELEQSADVSASLQEYIRFLKPGGLLLVHAPNYLSAKRLFSQYHFWPAINTMFRIVGRTVAHRPRFAYSEAPGVKCFISAIDLKLELERLGLKVLSYQAVDHLKEVSLRKRLGSIFFGDHMSLIRIVAKKGARYERH